MLDPDYVRRHAPTAPPVPVVFDSPHSGTSYPDDFRPIAPMGVLRMAEDTYVEELYGAAPRFGATLIEARFPRSYIDPNRSLEDLDPGLIDGAWPGPVTPGEKTRLGLGLIWRLAQPGMPIYDRKLSVAEVQDRIERCYRPYHVTVNAVLGDLHGRFGAVWHVNCHSMKPVGNAMSPDSGKARADFVLGDRDGTTCEGEFTTFVARILEGQGYAVAINDPYKGVELVRRYGRPAENRHSLQIEINRRLYMHQDTLAKSDGFERLRGHLTELSAAICDFARTRAARGG